MQVFLEWLSSSIARSPIFYRLALVTQVSYSTNHRTPTLFIKKTICWSIEIRWHNIVTKSCGSSGCRCLALSYIQCERGLHNRAEGKSMTAFSLLPSMAPPLVNLPLSFISRQVSSPCAPHLPRRALVCIPDLGRHLIDSGQVRRSSIVRSSVTECCQTAQDYPCGYGCLL